MPGESIRMDIQDLRIFARVAVVQNLSAVGTELGLTPGTISKRLQALEEELGARLFDRTTRSIRITEEGTTFLIHSRRILDELDTARASVSDNASNPKGKLKISAPASLAQRFVSPAICAFMRAFPLIDVQVDLTDRIVNLQEEGYDIAVRCGILSDSTLIAKRLAADRQIIVASPAYIAKHGPAKSAADLATHECLILGDNCSWTFEHEREHVNIRVSGRLRSNSGELLRVAAIEGLGLLRTAEIPIRDDLTHGRLVRVLPELALSADTAIWAVYPGPKHVLPKLRVLLDFLADWFRASLGDPGPQPNDTSRSKAAPPANPAARA